MPAKRHDGKQTAIRLWQILRRIIVIALLLCWLAAIGFGVWANLNERWGSGMRLAATILPVLFCCFLSLVWFALLAPLRPKVRWGITLAIVAVCVALVATLRLEEVTGGLRPRFAFRWAPRADERLENLPDALAQPQERIDLASVTDNDYPCFLGTDRLQSIDGVEFDTNWSETPPRCVWRQPIGAGWSSFVAVNGYAVTQEQRGDQELVTCYEIATGKLVWANRIAARHETKMGGAGPRATPCIDAGRVYAMGATGVFRCLDGATGKELWRQNLLLEMQIDNDEEAIAWGRSGSPLIVDQFVIVPVGGPENGSKTSLMAFDKITGDRVWSAGEHQISYASPARADLLGTEQIVIVLQDYVAAFQTTTGDKLWESPWPGRSNANANVSNAVPIDDNHVFLSKGYGQGAELLELSREESGKWNVRSVWKHPTVMKTKLSNVVVFEGSIFGLDDVILECIDAESGRKLWKRGRFGYGQLLRAGQVLIVVAEDGQVAAVEASPEQFLEHGRFVALDGKCWNNPCLFGPYLLVRNATEAACYELPNWRHDTSPSLDTNASR